MHLMEPGPVTERITLLGRPESCVQIVDGGGELALIGGAMSYVAPAVVDQIERFAVDVEKIRRLIILHAHFDHCGLVPALKRRWPWATITASARARELLSNTKVSRTIAAMNQAAARRFGLARQVRERDCQFTSIEVEEVVGDGDLLRCGDLSLQVLAVPGHSSCSIAVYVPELEALFPSDAAGVSVGDFFLAAGNSNFDLYQQSLEKMATLEVGAILREHYGAVLGDEARGFLARSIDEAQKTRGLLLDSIGRTGDVRRSTDEVVDALIDGAPEDFLPREVLAMVVGQMVRWAAKQAEASSSRSAP